MSAKHYSQAIALAWPETLCKCPNSWYDGLMEILGVSKNHYYKVGHAAIVLVDPLTQICHYFDFGRYHAPYGFGRVRNSFTDHELIIETKSLIDSNGQLLNINEILHELNSKSVWHGKGNLHAATLDIQFNKAYNKARKIQERTFIKYGPFIWNGTNCSRFVRTVLVAGARSWQSKLLLKLPYTLTPTPITNLNALQHYYQL